MSDERRAGEPGEPAEPLEQAAEPETEVDPGAVPAAAVAAEDAADSHDQVTVGDAPAAAPKDIGLLKEVLDALVFVHRGILPPKTVREVLGEEFTAEEIEAAFASLKEDYEERGGALVLAEVAGGWQFGTRTDLAPWIKKLDFYEHHRHLSRPTMETLAIIAYKQPVTRAEIEAIRGVNVERIVRNLLERKLVRILGHKDVPGKPMVLGTTREFLELFGLNSLAGLPPLKDFVEPPSPEDFEEEPPLPFPAGETVGESGSEEKTAEAAAAMTGQEMEHGPELETRDGKPDAPENGGEPAADTDEAG